LVAAKGSTTQKKEKNLEMQKRYTIIFIHRNGFSRLKSSLDSAINVLEAHDEIIIIDNASSDNSISKISNIYPNIQIIRNKHNAGYGYAANQGMRAGYGKYFLICNNDIILPQNILSAFDDIFTNDPKVGIISGKEVKPNGDSVRTSGKKLNLLTEFDGINSLNFYSDPTTISEVSILRGACLGVKKEMIEEIGAYDEDFFFYFEDTEWCIRAHKNSWKVILHPKIKIPHIGGSSSSELYSKSRIEFYRSRIIFWKKIFPKSIVVLLYLWNIPKLCLDLIFYSLITLITFGQNTRIRKKMIDRAVVLTWLLLGKPKKWGLPRKI